MADEKQKQPSAAPQKSSEHKEYKEPGKFWRHYYGATFLILTGVFVFASYYFLDPLVQDFRLLNQDIESKTRTLTDEREFLDTLNQSIAAAEAIPPDVLTRVHEALPREVGIPKLLVTMSTIAEQNNVELSGIQFTEPPQGAAQVGPDGMPVGTRQKISLVPVDINVKVLAEDYGRMRAYLEDLEHNLRVLDIVTISVSGNETTGALTYDVSLRAYTARTP